MGLCLLLLWGCQGASLDWQRLENPVPAPGFHLQALNGQTIELSDYRGHIVLIEFWATWCGPCRYSMPSLEEIYRRFRDRGVRVLFVNEGESPEVIEKWAGKRFSAPILMDQDASVARSYQVQGLPTLFIINQAGSILYVRSGYRGALERQLTLLLNDLLADGQTPDQ